MNKRILGVAAGLGLLLMGTAAKGDYKDLLRSVPGVGNAASASSGLTDQQVVDGLKEALEVGSAKAVEKVARPDGYFGNPKIKIPLPEPIQGVEKVLRATGFGSTVDDFELSMNRAAEKAAPEAKPLFLDAIRGMTLTDARKILSGRKNEATLYFEDKTSDRLETLFKPIVQDAMSQVGVTQSYQTLQKQVATIPFAGDAAFDLDQYVTGKAVDGLFKMLAAEEAKIRTDPAARTTDLLKTVFGR